MALEAGVPTSPYRDPTGSLEGSRDTDEGIVVSTEPDICLTPSGGTMVPVGYNICAKQADDARTTPTVKLTSLRSHNMASLITTCHGDEAGTGGGVKSGTHNGICEPKGHSATVYSEGKQMIRHTDEWWMNNRNTVGKLIYVKDAGAYGRWFEAQARRVQQARATTPQTATDAPQGPVPNASNDNVGSPSSARPNSPPPEPAVPTPTTSEPGSTTPSGDPGRPSIKPGLGIAAELGLIGAAIQQLGHIGYLYQNAPVVDIHGNVVTPESIEQNLAKQAGFDNVAEFKEWARQQTQVVRVTGSPKSPKDEICDAACKCKQDRGGARTYTECVAKKLRDKYYDQNGPKRDDGSPRYPTSPTADGPRPEVSYDPSSNFQAAPSKNTPGMPSSQVPISGMPRPDISWWSGGKLTQIYELKFANDRDTPMQRDGYYQNIARANGLDPKRDLIRVDVDKDCSCGPSGGKSK